MEQSDLINQIIKLTDQYFDDNYNKEDFVPNISKIPVSGRVLDKKDLEYLIKSSLELWLTSGEFTDEFEKKLSKKTGLRHCLFVNSGSSANLVAISALKKLYDLNDGDEIITSAVNFPTTLNPILQNNLIPVLVDAEVSSYNINTDLIEKQINKKTKGIVLAHTLGNPFDINKIKEICNKYKLFLMEDMCDAFGSKFEDTHVGTFGDVATLSFYPAHHITTGEGGAVLTNNPKLKKIMESFRDWGRDCYCPPGEENTCKKRFDWQLGELPHGYDHKYIYSNVGYNLKATDMQAAIGISQLDKIDQFIKTRKENFNYYYKNFKNLDEFIMPTWNKLSEPSWFGFPISLSKKAKFTRRDLLTYYDDRNIGTRLIFAGNIAKQPAYENLNIKISGKLENADYIMNNSFWLGVYPGLGKTQLDFVINETLAFLKERQK